MIPDHLVNHHLRFTTSELDHSARFRGEKGHPSPCARQSVGDCRDAGQLQKASRNIDQNSVVPRLHAMRLQCFFQFCVRCVAMMAVMRGDNSGAIGDSSLLS